jgi:hypothetical protein
MTQDVPNMIATLPDYIPIKRYKNSLALLEVRYPNGAPTHIVAQALGITEEEVETRYLGVVDQLRKELGVN